VDGDANAREQLLQLGVRTLPVIARGKQFLFANDLETVAEFVGVQAPRHLRIPPEELYRKWLKILRTGQRYVRQLPDEQMDLDAMPGRKKSVRMVAYHVFRHCDSYLECVLNGARDVRALDAMEPAAHVYANGSALASYGDQVIARLMQWWQALADKSCQEQIEVVKIGSISIHQLLERSVCLSAHNARQIADILERQGIVPDGTLTEDDISGLPLPKKLWN
jgi:hypothetical protein